MSDFTQLSREELIHQLELQENLLQQSGDTKALTQELQTYQIELEMQNRDLRQKQQELEIARDKYADLYDFAPIGYLTLNDKGIILEASLTAVALLQQTRNYILNKPFTVYLASGDSSDFHNSLKKALSTDKEQSVELRMKHPDGLNHDLYLQFLVSKNTKGEPEVRTAIIDITEKKLAARELILAKVKAEDANLAKSHFLARMSHELRTPLNAILGFAQILNIRDDSMTNAKIDSHVNKILVASRHLVEVVNDILNLSNIEAHKMDITIVNVNLHDQIQACVDIVLPLAQERDITIDYKLDKDLQKVAVRAEGLRLKQVLLNLLSNAIKYNRDGGSVTVECKPVDRNLIQIVITDTGLGIAADDFPVVFEPFSRLYLDTYAQQGTGIGLTLAKQMIELMGGTIGFESQLGIGSSFWIKLEQSPPAT